MHLQAKAGFTHLWCGHVPARLLLCEDTKTFLDHRRYDTTLSIYPGNEKLPEMDASDVWTRYGIRGGKLMDIRIAQS